MWEKDGSQQPSSDHNSKTAISPRVKESTKAGNVWYLGVSHSWIFTSPAIVFDCHNFGLVLEKHFNIVIMKK